LLTSQPLKVPWCKPVSSRVNPSNFLPNTSFKEVHTMPDHTDDNAGDSTVLQLVNVSKSFGPVNVIKDATLSVRRGQVQALLGENGAGKSTLINMIAGVHQPDSGKILVDGSEVTIASNSVSEAHGIATIHQELNLVPTLSVAENIMLGRTPKRFGLVNRKHLNAQAQAALNLIGL